MQHEYLPNMLVKKNEKILMQLSKELSKNLTLPNFIFGKILQYNPSCL